MCREFGTTDTLEKIVAGKHHDYVRLRQDCVGRHQATFATISRCEPNHRSSQRNQEFGIQRKYQFLT